MDIDLEKEEEIKAALTFANEITLMALRAPNVICEKYVNEAAHKMRNRFGRSPRMRKAIIWAFIRKGAASVNELVAESGLPRQDVQKIIQELEAEQKITLRKMPVGDRGGRPPTRIFLTEPAVLHP